MTFQRKPLFIGFTILLGCTLLWNAALYILDEHTTVWNYLYNMIFGAIYGIGGLVSLVYAIQFSLKSNLGKMLLFFGLGLLCFWLGNMIWVYYTFFLDVEIPFPSFADVSYIMLYPCMTIGTIYLLLIYKTLITRRLVRNSILIVSVSFILIFGFFARPDISSDLSFAQQFINIAYPFGDVLTLSVACIALQIGGGRIHPSLFIFSFGLFLQTMADITFIYRNAVGTYWNGDVSDLLYTFAAYVMSIGIFELINNLLSVSVSPSAQAPVSYPSDMTKEHTQDL